jgi:histidyl-tRNA synthetase
MKKQMSYANAKQIPYVAIVGESELAEGKVNVKNMTTGEQMLVEAERILECIQ